MTATGRRNWQFTFFLGAGVMATAAHYAVMVLLASGLGMGAVTAASVGYVVGAVVSYALNYRFVFRSTGSHGRTMLRFLGVVMLGFIVNRQIVSAGTEWLHVHYLPAQVVATGAVFLLNFILSKLWAFKAP